VVHFEPRPSFEREPRLVEHCPNLDDATGALRPNIKFAFQPRHASIPRFPPILSICRTYCGSCTPRSCHQRHTARQPHDATGWGSLKLVRCSSVWPIQRSDDPYGSGHTYSGTWTVRSCGMFFLLRGICWSEYDAGKADSWVVSYPLVL
jgi:hypothetical protein